MNAHIQNDFLNNNNILIDNDIKINNDNHKTDNVFNNNNNNNLHIFNVLERQKSKSNGICILMYIINICWIVIINIMNINIFFPYINH